MKKAMCIAIAGLMVAGMSTAFAGDCGGCCGKKSDKKEQCSSNKDGAQCSTNKTAKAESSDKSE